MDTLAQLRSNMFEDIAVLIPDELPAAGTTPGIKHWLHSPVDFCLLTHVVFTACH